MTYINSEQGSDRFNCCLKIALLFLVCIILNWAAVTLLLILRYVSVFGGGTLMPLNNAISRPEKKPNKKIRQIWHSKKSQYSNRAAVLICTILCGVCANKYVVWTENCIEQALSLASFSSSLTLSPFFSLHFFFAFVLCTQKPQTKKFSCATFFFCRSSSSVLQ